MEALRNYAQHRNMFLVLRYPANWGDGHPTNPTSRLRFRLSQSLDVARIETDGGFKARTLAELKGKTTVSITLLAREYLEALGQRHEWLRSTIAADVTRWEALLADVVARAEPLDGPAEAVIVEAVGPMFDVEEADRNASVHITPALVSYRRTLAARLQGFQNFSKRYVSGQE